MRPSENARGRGAVEEHDRSGRWFRAERRTLADGFLQCAQRGAAGILDGQGAVHAQRVVAVEGDCTRGAPLVAEHDNAVLDLAVNFSPDVLVPAVAGQSARIAHRMEFAVA